MAKNGSMIALEADPNDPEDFAVTQAAVDRGLAARRARGRQRAPIKEQVTLRLDPDILARFRATGPGWQGRINEALRQAAV